MTELDNMTDQDFALGPIDYLAVEFPEARMNGEGLAAILDLVDRGLVRILDLRAVKITNGAATRLIHLVTKRG